MAVAQAEGLGGRMVVGSHHLALAEVVAAAVASQLAHFLGEDLLVAGLIEGAVEAVAQGIGGAVVADVLGVFAALDPVLRDSQFAAEFGGCALGDDAATQGGVDRAALGGLALASARAGGGAFQDRFDEGAAGALVLHGGFGKVQLQEAHGALDVHADGAGVDVRRRDQGAADGGAVAAVSIGVEHELGDARGGARVDGLAQADFVEGLADRLGTDHGDRRA